MLAHIPTEWLFGLTIPLDLIILFQSQGVLLSPVFCELSRKLFIGIFLELVVQFLLLGLELRA